MVGKGKVGELHAYVLNILFHSLWLLIGCVYLALQDIPGCGKFRKQGLHNEENLKLMFEDITNDSSDHWNPTLGIPPPSSEALADALHVDDIQDLDLQDTEAPPTLGEVGASASSVKRLGKFVHDKSKKPRPHL